MATLGIVYRNEGRCSCEQNNYLDAQRAERQHPPEELADRSQRGGDMMRTGWGGVSGVGVGVESFDLASPGAGG